MPMSIQARDRKSSDVIAPILSLGLLCITLISKVESKGTTATYYKASSGLTGALPLCYRIDF